MALTVRPMREGDLAEVDRILRVAFGTFLGAPDPEHFFGDTDFAGTRFRAAPDLALTALDGDRIVGSNFVTRWGSFGFFGPLSVEPALWDTGVARALLGPTVELLAPCADAGLYTFSSSAKHHALYQKFGFWPRFLTAVMAKAPQAGAERCRRFSTLTGAEKQTALSACRAITDVVHAGLEVGREILAVDTQGLGDTVLLDAGAGFAVVHAGAGSEAGGGVVYAKFGCARDGAAFADLLDACEAFAADAGAGRLIAGVNLARREAYAEMIRRDFRAGLVGVAMHRPDAPGFCRPGAFVIDDWR